MNILFWFENYSLIFKILFLIGLPLIFYSETRKSPKNKRSRLLSAVAWLITIPGYYIFGRDLLNFSLKIFAHYVHYTYYALLVLIPLFAIGLWLLNRKRSQHPDNFFIWISEHVVFLVTAVMVFSIGFYKFRPQAFHDMRELQLIASMTEHAVAQDFQFLNIKTGQPENLSDYKGNVILLNFWATWCGPCRIEMPELDKLNQELEANGLRVIHVSNEQKSVIEDFLAKRTMSTIFGYFEDPGVMPTSYLPWKTNPTTFVIDREGNIADVKIGAKSYAEFKEAVENVL